MTDTEKRELDAWIAEHVMGYRRTYNPDDHTTDAATLFWHRPAGDTRESVLIGSAWQYKNYGPKEMFSHSWTHYAPTTDPAAAMEVLKKCAEKLEVINSSIALGQQFDELVEDRLFWFVSHERTKEITEAETLELAICLFAKKLFTK